MKLIRPKPFRVSMLVGPLEKSSMRSPFEGVGVDKLATSTFMRSSVCAEFYELSMRIQNIYMGYHPPAARVMISSESPSAIGV